MKKLRKTIYLKIARFLGRGKNGASVPSIIADNTTIEGNITSSGILHIDGNIKGDITCDELIIGVKGSVIGTIKAQNMYLYGTLNGQAFVDSLFIAKTARIIGDTTHKTIAIEPGAYIEGHCFREKSSPASTEEKPQKTAPSLKDVK